MRLAMVDNYPWRQQLFDGLLADRWLLLVVAVLLSFGAVMVSSSSISVAALSGSEGGYGDPWYFARRHGVFLLISLVACAFVASVPLALWRRYGWIMLLAAIVILILVLIPGIGTMANYSRRWLRFGPINLQASELAKFCSIIFFASYLAKWHKRIQAHTWAILKPLAILFFIAVLILMEPDLGTTVVLMASVLAMMFIAGIKIWQCFGMGAFGYFALQHLLFSKEYRRNRLDAFLDPWSHQFDSGYQLVQSLIGFGRGEWLGLGLGNSIQKLFFLPESHTDFIFAVVAEEFGFIGALVVLSLFVVLIVKAFLLTRKAIQQDNDFACFASFGIGVLFACQVFINIGVASGLLPTKGLTLPFVSYGGSSLLVCMMLVGLLLRIQKELNDAQLPKAGGNP
ncbi:putative lipid II flippase FtsW [Halioxenophilus sp. WMMB6]|uniref:putative lipid II flippase FtsW n=1 Tax=Halioxenophilus sp. WMMB6 TaxID=3073815 RepID=UPI00295F5A8C|nr:putative lipid II flippase FtsW [Halioxenophilus sp. WMMB6]